MKKIDGSQVRRLHAMRQVRSYLTSVGERVAGLKQKAIIKAFADSKGLTPDCALRDWIVDLWESKSDPHVFKMDRPFYVSDEWAALRLEVFNRDGKRCARCASTKSPTVDHIKPRSLHPDLELDAGNMQVLCRSCNSSKGNRHAIDYRVPG